ncbi:glycoside hydrolase family 47 protein [Powellomyces hirtus]|nr:glycoside hydrolase family 47 protein [Powellomyces hirtus]
MEHAFPQDELNPLACTGRSRDNDPHNWNVNDVLGNFSLTLVDALDTHAIMNDHAKFEKSVALVIEHVTFDLDSRVQVFEVTIRVLGALLSAHILATDEDLGFQIPWYRGELLNLARQLGDKLMPAFDTPTGIPWPRVNLKTGVLPYEADTTCSAGAGTLILEFGILSRLTGNSSYEDAAKQALWAVWERRSPLDLVGNTVGVLDGKWYNQLAGIGAGIDSFYEYLFKAYVLFGEQEYYDVFEVAYRALMKYVRDEKGIVYKNVNMDTGALAASWIDSLAAFFPGLQVMVGDLPNAAALHQLYVAIWTRYSALPERFDFSTRAPAISSYPLRPELIESTYMLYQATGDHYYLEVGERILNDLEKMARVPCGFATLSDVVQGKHDDRMESFFLSETLKYLYLLFDEDNIVHQVHGNHVFTTEGHLLMLPYQLLKHSGASAGERDQKPHPSPLICHRYEAIPLELRIRLPGSRTRIPLPLEQIELINRLVGNDPDANDVAAFDVTGLEKIHKVKVQPSDGIAYPPSQIDKTSTGYFANHLAGVILQIIADEEDFRVTAIDDMELSPDESITVPKQGVSFLGSTDDPSNAVADSFASPLAQLIIAGMKPIPVAVAAYGPVLGAGEQIDGMVLSTDRTSLPTGCHPYTPDESSRIEGKFLLVSRGGCSFSEKSEWAEIAGSIGLIVANNEGSSIFPMAPTGEQVDTFSIPSIMVSANEGSTIHKELGKGNGQLPIVLKGPDTDRVLEETQIQFGGRPIKNIHVVKLWRKKGEGGMNGRRDTRGRSLIDIGTGFWGLRHCGVTRTKCW